MRISEFCKSLNSHFLNKKEIIMYGFFSSNSLQSQLAAARGRVEDLTRQMDSAQMQGSVSLDLDYQRLQYQIKQGQDNLVGLGNQVARYQQQVSDYSQQKNQAASQLQQCQGQQQQLTTQIQSLDQRIAQLRQRQQELRQIISSPRPPEKWGNYCENGHLDCKNLPNKVHRLGNKAELDAFDQKAVNSRKEFQRLERQIANLQSQESDLDFQQAQVIRQKSDAQTQYDQCSSWLDVANMNLSQTQSSYNSRQQDLDRLQAQLDQAQQGKDSNQSQIDSLQQSLYDAQDQVASLEAQMSQMQVNSNDDRAARLADIARRELEQERAAAAGAPAENQAQRLMRLAREEYEREKDTVREYRDEARDLVRGIRHTLSNWYPNAGAGALTDAMFDRVNEEFFDQEPGQTGDCVIDAARRRGR